MQTPHEHNHSHEDEKETSRIEAFSDGVFAIALTLLVLDLKIPEASSNHDLWLHVWEQWPIFLAHFISFLTILIMWVNHHHLFKYIRKINNTFLFINGFLLLFISLTPFPTSLLAEGIKNGSMGAAAIIYAGNAFLIGFMFNLLWRYASKNNRLLDIHTTKAAVEGINKQYRFGPHIYFVIFLITCWNPLIGIGLCLLLALFFAFIGIFAKGETYN